MAERRHEAGDADNHKNPGPINKVQIWSANVRGLTEASYATLTKLLQDIQPDVMLLQELKSSQTHLPRFEGYKVFSRLRDTAAGTGNMLVFDQRCDTS